MLDPESRGTFPSCFETRIAYLRNAVADEIWAHKASLDELVDELAVFLLESRQLCGA
ncbi:MAG: hypothetical protein QOG18_2746 [Microbacteriaceae bacterium]|nr:hypothetical protein [Microbacteriaceae bacterium]